MANNEQTANTKQSTTQHNQLMRATALQLAVSVLPNALNEQGQLDTQPIEALANTFLAFIHTGEFPPA